MTAPIRSMSVHRCPALSHAQEAAYDDDAARQAWEALKTKRWARAVLAANAIRDEGRRARALGMIAEAEGTG